MEVGEGEENKGKRDQEEVFTPDQLNQLAVQVFTFFLSLLICNV